MFGKLSDLKDWLATQLGSSNNETISVAFNNRIAGGTTGNLSQTPNTNSDVAITIFSEPSNTVLISSGHYVNPADWGSGPSVIFQHTYDKTALAGDTSLLILLNLTGDSATAEYYKSVPIGKGNQTVDFELDSAQ